MQRLNDADCLRPLSRGIENLAWSMPSSRTVKHPDWWSQLNSWTAQQALRSIYWSCRCCRYVSTAASFTSIPMVLSLIWAVNLWHTAHWLNLDALTLTPPKKRIHTIVFSSPPFYKDPFRITYLVMFQDTWSGIWISGHLPSGWWTPAERCCTWADRCTRLRTGDGLPGSNRAEK